MSINTEIPKRSDVLVIGGGPAGSGVAALLAKKGVDVVLLEKASHPRPQVGESLIPHFWKYADQIGVSPLLEKEGFSSPKLAASRFGTIKSAVLPSLNSVLLVPPYMWKEIFSTNCC